MYNSRKCGFTLTHTHIHRDRWAHRIVFDKIKSYSKFVVWKRNAQNWGLSSPLSSSQSIITIHIWHYSLVCIFLVIRARSCLHKVTMFLNKYWHICKVKSYPSEVRSWWMCQQLSCAGQNVVLATAQLLAQKQLLLPYFCLQWTNWTVKLSVKYRQSLLN